MTSLSRSYLHRTISPSTATFLALLRPAYTRPRCSSMQEHTVQPIRRSDVVFFRFPEQDLIISALSFLPSQLSMTVRSLSLQLADTTLSHTKTKDFVCSTLEQDGIDKSFVLKIMCALKDVASWFANPHYVRASYPEKEQLLKQLQGDLVICLCLKDDETILKDLVDLLADTSCSYHELELLLGYFFNKHSIDLPQDEVDLCMRQITQYADQLF